MYFFCCNGSSSHLLTHSVLANACQVLGTEYLMFNRTVLIPPLQVYNFVLINPFATWGAGEGEGRGNDRNTLTASPRSLGPVTSELALR